MEPRDGYEIVTLGAVCLPRCGDVGVFAGIDAPYDPDESSFNSGGLSVGWDSGMKVYRPLPPKDAKDEEIEFLRRVADQAIVMGSIRLSEDNLRLLAGIKEGFITSSMRSGKPDLYKYLQDREAK